MASTLAGAVARRALADRRGRGRGGRAPRRRDRGAAGPRRARARPPPRAARRRLGACPASRSPIAPRCVRGCSDCSTTRCCSAAEEARAEMIGLARVHRGRERPRIARADRAHRGGVGRARGARPRGPARRSRRPLPAAPADGHRRLAGQGRRGADRGGGGSASGSARTSSCTSWSSRRAAGSRPYSPDVLMEIVVTEHSVEASLPEELARPRRLTPAEGFALVGRRQDDPGRAGRGRRRLARPSAASKLEAVLGAREGLNVDLAEPPAPGRRATTASTRADPPTSSTTRARATRSPSRRSTRSSVVSLDGHWYLDAYCHRAEGLRRFRVDRIR